MDFISNCSILLIRYEFLSNPRITQMTAVLVINLDEDNAIYIIYSLRDRIEVKAKNKKLMIIFIV